MIQPLKMISRFLHQSLHLKQREKDQLLEQFGLIMRRADGVLLG